MSSPDVADGYNPDSTQPFEAVGNIAFDPCVTETEIEAGVAGRFRTDVQAALERLDRHAADARLYAAVAAAGFEGPEYQVFANALARYGIAVMHGWLHSGHVFKLVADRRMQLHPSERELTHLADCRDDRDELANMTVAVALDQFRTRSLAGTGWRADGGASLTTYFMGACILAFPNRMREFRTQRTKWERQDRAHEMRDAPDRLADLRGATSATEMGRNPADIYVGTEIHDEMMNNLTDRERRIFADVQNGYTYAEIAEMHGEPSDRAVEGVIYRMLVKLRKRVHRTEVDE